MLTVDVESDYLHLHEQQGQDESYVPRDQEQSMSEAVTVFAA
jgi:hypothetical protein